MQVNQIKAGVFAQVGLKVTPHAAEHYKGLIGKTIKEIIFQEMDGQALPILVFTDKTNAAVMCDPEGNGPGHLDLGE